MLDLSGISLAALNSLVAEETARRKSTARFELQAIAEKHGFDLSDLVGGKASRKNSGPHHADTRGAWGHAAETIISGLQAGLHAREIADQLGWVNYGGVYTIAAKNGMKISKGRLQQ